MGAKVLGNVRSTSYNGRQRKFFGEPMATAEQLKSLIQSHFNSDMERFHTIALQVAAHEARQGHAALAQEIRGLVEREQRAKYPRVIPFPHDLSGLVLTEQPQTPKSALVVPEILRKRIERILLEYRQRSKLKSHGLSHRRKLLLVGPPGTGKTMTARVVARELHLPLHTIQVDRLVTKFMGETSAKLRQIFDLMREGHGVYLFDEFDAIGGERSRDNDVGEMRRVLNAFLQFIEQDQSESFIIAATNNSSLLDGALFRRFEDVVHYDYPSAEERQALIMNILGVFLAPRFSWKQVMASSRQLSHAEIDSACRDAIKNSILSDKSKVTAAGLLETLRERHGAHQGKRG